jgi:hypothetical protein
MAFSHRWRIGVCFAMTLGVLSILRFYCALTVFVDSASKAETPTMRVATAVVVGLVASLHFI